MVLVIPECKTLVTGFSGMSFRKNTGPKVLIWLLAEADVDASEIPVSTLSNASGPIPGFFLLLLHKKQ